MRTKRPMEHPPIKFPGYRLQYRNDIGREPANFKRDRCYLTARQELFENAFHFIAGNKGIKGLMGGCHKKSCEMGAFSCALFRGSQFIWGAPATRPCFNC